ncbi:HlyD family secretion protein [Mesorhizobium sp. BH1-1-5]|uniref:HlyD family secretion protein n=1 Tax=Mesorhizobium sp. BH1-1-5 TaxID=2876661 RepID=UPI001CCB4FAA|nr:HlyD family secretion protein [Mesorhizobium sp. BH1-1-5]MBZ9991238.1 HlyD family secretion protein [Mesorhizobium sp. BH1-1-5]
MGALLLLGYAAICVVVFKVMRLPVNKWTATTACLGGVVVVGGLLAIINYNHPFTTEARLYFFTTPIIPEVKGRVVEVPVEPNLALKKGDVLFKIDPEPYKFVVAQKEAAVAEAEQGVKQLKSSQDQAAASVAKAEAQLELAQQAFDRQTQLLEKKVVAQATVDTASHNLEAANQSLAESQAALERARLAYLSEIGGVNTTVARLTADLRDAEYDLDQTVVRAPTAGYVTQLFLRPGMMAGTAPALIFIHEGDRVFAAAFPQAVVQRLTVGSEAEIAFDAIPGKVFQGKVSGVADAVSQGQLQASPTLLNPEDRGQTQGLALVGIQITDDVSGYQLPAGSTAQVAVYSTHMASVAVVRRILLRMKSWMNYIV